METGIQQQRKKPAIRAFNGLAGSFLSTNTEKDASPSPAPTPTALSNDERASRMPTIPAGIGAQPLTATEATKRLREETAAMKSAAKQYVKMSAEEKKEFNRKKREDENTAKQAEKRAVKLIAQNAKDAAKAIKKANRMPLLSDGMYMTGAPAGKGLIQTGGFGMVDIDELVGKSIADHGGIYGGVEPWFDEGHGRRVVPEGTGQRFGAANVDKVMKSNGSIYDDDKDEIGREYNCPVPRAAQTFKVRLGECYSEKDAALDYEKQIVLDILHGTYEDGLLKSEAFEFVPDSDLMRCKVCHAELEWGTHAENHFESCVDSEILAYAEDKARTKKLKDAWDEFLATSFLPPPIRAGLPPTKTAPIRRGAHAQLFVTARKERRKHLRELTGHNQPKSSGINAKTTAGKHILIGESNLARLNGASSG